MLSTKFSEAENTPFPQVTLQNPFCTFHSTADRQSPASQGFVVGGFFDASHLSSDTTLLSAWSKHVTLNGIVPGKQTESWNVDKM